MPLPLQSRVTLFCGILCASLALPSSCNKFDSRGYKFDLRPGLNYMQPMKWRMTYHYRVQEIIPKNRIRDGRASAIDPGVPAVGKGTYEVWLTKPWEGETMLNMVETYADPKPTKVVQGKDTDAIFYYYDFAPDGYLPQEIEATVSWEFITCEAYCYSDGPPLKAAYDPNDPIVKQYTKLEKPYTYNPKMGSRLTEIKNASGGDPVERARHSYNYLVGNFVYDHAQTAHVALSGLEGMTDAYRAWENQHGQCDEISNVYITLLRKMGIPARPVLGWAHFPEEQAGSYGMVPGGHAWTEFYVPNIGWVPADATWGTSDEPVVPQLSMLGTGRQLSYGEYYFGHMDTYRVVLYKDIGYTLQPPPRTPGAKKSEYWNLGCAERNSGVESVVYGWEGVVGMGDGETMGWARSKKYEGDNCDIELVALGSPSKDELAKLETQLDERGIHYVRTPPVRGQFPIMTMGRDMMLSQGR